MVTKQRIAGTTFLSGLLALALTAYSGGSSSSEAVSDELVQFGSCMQPHDEPACDDAADDRDGTTILSEIDTSSPPSEPSSVMASGTDITTANIGDSVQAEDTPQPVIIEILADEVITNGSTVTTDPVVSTTSSTVENTDLGTIYYVDRNNTLANDANAGTATEPFLTISRGAQVARAGDMVVVMDGVYPESVDIANSGTVTQPITITANGNVVVDSPTTDSWSGVFNVVGKTDIVISGFTVKNAYYGIKIDKDRAGMPSERITVKNNYATLSKSSGIRVAFSRNVTVDSNVVEKTNWGGVHEMISIIDTDGFSVQNNEVFNGMFVMNDVVMEGKEGIDAKDGSRNGRIINNKVHDLMRLGIYLDAWDALTHTIEVSGNVVYNCKQGIALSSESGGLLQNVLVSNNITYNNRAYGIIVPIWVANGPRENIRIANNTVYGNASGGINIGTTNAYLIEIQNNIVANNGGAALNAANVGVIASSSNNLVVGRNPGNILFGTITGEPRFVDAATGNFQLNTGSAAIDQGMPLTEVPQDIVGTARPLGSAHDIGAYESW